MKCKRCRDTKFIGGAAITRTKCKECGREMAFPSTVVDRYCGTCAEKLRKCQHCGEDMNYE